MYSVVLREVVIVTCLYLSQANSLTEVIDQMVFVSVIYGEGEEKEEPLAVVRSC